MDYMSYISRVRLRDMICQIVNENGVPANDYVYTDLELAEEVCNNLVENYNEYHTVRILTPYPQKK